MKRIVAMLAGCAILLVLAGCAEDGVYSYGVGTTYRSPGYYGYYGGSYGYYSGPFDYYGTYYPYYVYPYAYGGYVYRDGGYRGRGGHRFRDGRDSGHAGHADEHHNFRSGGGHEPTPNHRYTRAPDHSRADKSGGGSAWGGDSYHRSGRRY